MSDLKVVREPRIFVVGRTSLNDYEVQAFLLSEHAQWLTDDAEEPGGAELIAELGGRVCYMSFGQKQGRTSNQDYLENIIESHHGSVLEHAVWNFIVTGVSRSFTHELVRHRVGVAYSQLSQRYVDESKTAFVVPPLIQEAFEQAVPGKYDVTIGKTWHEAMGHALSYYRALSVYLGEYVANAYPDLPTRQRIKMVREAARSVLPNATETKLMFSANARALRHIIELRGSEHAEAEMRRFAVKLLHAMQTEASHLFSDFEIDGGVVKPPSASKV